VADILAQYRCELTIAEDVDSVEARPPRESIQRPEFELDSTKPRAAHREVE
jgi:hypothetical protein